MLLFIGMYFVTLGTLFATFFFARALGRCELLLGHDTPNRTRRRYLTWGLAVCAYPISWIVGGWIGFYGGGFVAYEIHSSLDWPQGVVAGICIPLAQMVAISLGCLGVPLAGFLTYSICARLFRRY